MLDRIFLLFSTKKLRHQCFLHDLWALFHFLETAKQNSSCWVPIIMGIVVAAYTFSCLRRQNNAQNNAEQRVWYSRLGIALLMANLAYRLIIERQNTVTNVRQHAGGLIHNATICWTVQPVCYKENEPNDSSWDFPLSLGKLWDESDLLRLM